MKIFLTGCSGFLGLNVVRRLVSLKYEVIALVRKENPELNRLDPAYLHIVYGNLETIDRIDCPDFDVCLHFAWGGVNRTGVSDIDCQRINLENALRLPVFAERHHCRTFIDAGSRQEYAPSNEWLTEESECRPVSVYGQSKLESFFRISEICSRLGIRYIHYRIFSVYGLGDHPWSLINSSIDGLLRNEDLKLGLCRHRWSFLYIEDFVDAVVRTIERKDFLEERQVLNLGSSRIKVLRDFVEVIYRICGADSVLQYGAFPENKESTFSVMPDMARTCRVLDWTEKVPFEQGIRDIIDKKSSE